MIPFLVLSSLWLLQDLPCLVLSYFILMSQPAHPHVVSSISAYLLGVLSRASLSKWQPVPQLEWLPLGQGMPRSPALTSTQVPETSVPTRSILSLISVQLRGPPSLPEPTLFFLAVLDLSCGMQDLSSWTRTEARPPALGAQSLSHWTTREVPP